MNELIIGIQLVTLIIILFLYILMEKNIMSVKDDILASISASKDAVKTAIQGVSAEVDRVVQLVSDLKSGSLSAADIAEIKAAAADAVNVQTLGDLKLQLSGAQQ